MTPKPARVLLVQAGVYEGRLGFSFMPIPFDDVYGYRHSPADYATHFRFQGTRYDITIVSCYPSIPLDRQTALNFAIAYASHTLKVVTLDPNAGTRTPGVLDIETESVIYPQNAIQ